jgi:hypothetical protein
MRESLITVLKLNFIQTFVHEYVVMLLVVKSIVHPLNGKV